MKQNGLNDQILLILSFLSVQTFVWMLVLGSSVFDGRKNRAYTRKFATIKGSRFSWERGFFEDCCIRLYSGSSCSNQIGFSLHYIFNFVK